MDRINRIRTLVPGKVQGRLLGGNLSLVTHLIGTPYHPDLSGAILFLKDVSEPIYSIDRMLTQLWLSGDLAKVAGVVFGKFTDRPAGSGLHNQTLEEVLLERVNALNIPSAMGLMIGHVDDQTTIPEGCLAEFDADAGTLKLLEAGVI